MIEEERREERIQGIEGGDLKGRSEWSRWRSESNRKEMVGVENSGEEGEG